MKTIEMNNGLFRGGEGRRLVRGVLVWHENQYIQKKIILPLQISSGWSLFHISGQ
jgi:hypothetical protein